MFRFVIQIIWTFAEKRWIPQIVFDAMPWFTCWPSILLVKKSQCWTNVIDSCLVNHKQYEVNNRQCNQFNIILKFCYLFYQTIKMKRNWKKKEFGHI